MKKAIWFSRHQPISDQREDAANMGYDLLVTTEGIALGTMELLDNRDVEICVSGLLGHCADIGAEAIFGVFAAPILTQIARTAEDIRQRGEIIEPKDGKGDYPCFAAWNIMRAEEGKKPTFLHKKWLGIGRLNQDSCRWL